jgi:peptide methionine sulfoxide reductase MsrB
MLLFFLVAAVLAVLAYYVFGSEESTEMKGTKSPVDRERKSDRERKPKNTGPEIHQKKVESKAKNEFKLARERVSKLKEKGDLKEIARGSYVLSESLQKMFSSDQFFEKKTRFNSFRTAIKAAEEARDKLIDRRKKNIRRADIPDASASDYVGDKYVRNATESALMVAWCAGGLIGKSKYDSAQEAFRTSVSPEDVQSWERFGQVLHKESAHYMIDPPPSA